MFKWLTFDILAWIAGVLGVAVVSLGVLLWAAGVRIDDVKNQRDKVEIKLGEAKTTIRGQTDALDRCDKQTKSLKVESDKKASDADEAVRRAQQEARKYVEGQKRRSTILAGPTPPGAGCSQAIATLRPELRK